jgi:gliding motility-associated lipoprotein GldB
MFHKNKDFIVRKSVLNRLLLVCFVVFVFMGCQFSDSKKEISEIPVAIEWVRFEQKFYRSSPQELPALKKEFPYFFPSQYSDAIWEQRLIDSLQLELFDQINKVFPSIDSLQAQAKSLFQHIKYYFPETNIPKIITVVSDVDYHNKIIDADSLLLVSIDTYLGKDNHLYSGIPKYISANLNKEQIIPDMVSVLSKRYISSPQNRTLLSQMIFRGKQLYLKDLFLPSTIDHLKIGYSQKQLSWVQENEAHIWRFFVEQKLLFSSNTNQIYRFIDPAPFTKFYLDIDQESPGRVGQWLGWMIVRSFAQNNDVSLPELLAMPANELFQKSKYKPSRK